MWRRLSGEAPRGAFPLKGSNFFPRPEVVSADAWNADIALLKEMHLRLRGAVAAVRPELLSRPLRPSRRRGATGEATTPFGLIAGVIAHDLYHAGQIQLIKQLFSQRDVRRGS